MKIESHTNHAGDQFLSFSTKSLTGPFVLELKTWGFNEHRKVNSNGPKCREA